MLFSYRSLIFPKVEYIKDTKFRSWGDKDTKHNSTKIYKLKWSDKHILPEPYDTWLNRLTFALPEKYLVEIRRCARMAQLEWQAHKPFDTAVLDQAPAAGFVYNIAQLLKDCVFDQNTEYFYRGDDKTVVKYIILYKFWTANVGCALVQQYSNIYDLGYLISKIWKKSGEKKYGWIAKEFIEAMDKYENDLCENSPDLQSIDKEDWDWFAFYSNIARSQYDLSQCEGWTPLIGLKGGVKTDAKIT